MPKETQDDLTTGDDNIDFDALDDALFEGATEANLELDADIVADVKTEEVTIEDAAPEADEANAEKEQTEAPKAEDVTDANAKAENEPAKEDLKPNDGMMPYGAYASEKQKRVDLEGKVSAAELENNRLKAENALLRNQQPKPKAPDMYDDPQGYEAHIKREANDAHYQNMLNTAKLVAPSIVSQGDITAAEAYFAAQGIPQERLDMANRDALSKGQNPVVELVNWHKGELKKQRFAQWDAQQQAANGTAPAATAAQSQPAPKLPPNVAGVAPANVKSESFASLDDIDDKLFG